MFYNNFSYLYRKINKNKKDMESIVQLASFELNEGVSHEEWKKMSDHINDDLKGVDGFIYRDSARGEDGKYYCILKWESREQEEVMKKRLESEEYKGAMEAFAKLVNMETMKSETLKVV